MERLGSRECFVGGAPVVLTSREDQLVRRLLLANGACRIREKLAPVTVDNVRGLGYRIGVR